jgi:hypothetical protein
MKRKRIRRRRRPPFGPPGSYLRALAEVLSDLNNRPFSAKEKG